MRPTLDRPHPNLPVHLPADRAPAGSRLATHVVAGHGHCTADFCGCKEFRAIVSDSFRCECGHRYGEHY